MKPWTRVLAPALWLLSIGCAALVYSSLRGQSLAFGFAGQRFELLAPVYLAFVCTLPVLAHAALGSLASLPAAQRWLSFATRSALVVVLALAVCRLVRNHESLRVCTVFAVDVSDSISAPGLARASQLVHAALAARGDNEARVLTFAARPQLTPPTAGAGATLSAFQRPKASASDPDAGSQTNLQAAIRLAYGAFPEGMHRRIVLISDGNETRGDVLSEAKRAARFQIQVDHLSLPNAQPPEVAVRSVELPSDLEVGKPFRVHVRLFATQRAELRLKLYQDETLNGLEGIRDLTLPPGDTELELASIVRMEGPVTYRAQIEPRSPDHFSANNAASAAVVVPGRPRVLLIDSDTTQITNTASALSRADFEVEVRSPVAMPRMLAELSRYDFFILSDVEQTALPAQTSELIERYVRDAGGGFMMAGGDKSFGLGGYQGTRMEQLLPVHMAAQRRRDEHSLALALVIDCSGSMAGQKMELAKEAAKATAEVLGDTDSIEVVGFSSEAERKVRLQSARNRVGIAQNIARLVASGGTQIFPALDMAYQDLAVVRARYKHVILLTDGQTQEAGIAELVQAMRADGITVSTVGLGADVNRNLLQTSASQGGGRAYFTNDPNNVPRIFVNETTSIARQSAVEELVAASVREPADFLKGIDIARAPLLRGYVAVEAKDAPAQVILQSELGEPLLARWRVGLGFALAWTPDLKPRWAVDWLRWPELSRFLAQLVREHMRTQKTERLPMHVQVHDGVAHAIVDALGADDHFMDGLASDVSLDDLSARPRRLAPLADHPTRMSQTAPGRYEAWLPLPGQGAFALHAVHRRGQQVIAHSDAQAQDPYPLEYAALADNPALLAEVGKLTGGLADPSVAQIWRRGPGRVETREELWPVLVALGLGLFLIDLWVRRVRLFPRKLA